MSAFRVCASDRCELTICTAVNQWLTMVKLSVELIQQAYQHINPVRDRELDLRGYKIPVIENLGATLVSTCYTRPGAACWFAVSFRLTCIYCVRTSRGDVSYLYIAVNIVYITISLLFIDSTIMLSLVTQQPTLLFNN